MSTHADGPPVPSSPAPIPELHELVCTHHFNARMVKGITMAQVHEFNRILRLSLLNAFLADPRADGLTGLRCERIPSALRQLRDQEGKRVPLCCWLPDIVATTAIGVALNGNVWAPGQTYAAPNVLKSTHE